VSALAAELLVDDTRAILAAIRERGIRIDPRLRVECRQLFGNPGVRMNYQRPDGLTIDGVGELLVDRGFIRSGLSERDVLELLETLFAPQPKTRRARRPPRARAQTDAAVERARNKRLRKFECETCRQIARGGKNALLLCGLCYEMSGTVARMVRVDPLPEEIIAAEILAAESESAA
jgi:hypothetical protein